MEWKHWNEEEERKEVKLVLSYSFTDLPRTLQKREWEDSRKLPPTHLPYYTLNDDHTAYLPKISQLFLKLINHQLKVNYADSLLAIMNNVASPGLAFNVDQDTSWKQSGAYI